MPTAVDNHYQRLVTLYKQAEKLLLRSQRTTELKTLRDNFEKVRQSHVAVLVCGEFKRGKSSFINSLLEEPVCPVDVGIATSVVSFIQYGAERRVTRYYGDIHDLKKETISYDEIEKYAKGSAMEIDNTVMLSIELPSPVLQNGLVLIDTPGVGGLDPRHLFLTLYVLPKADLTLFMLDAGEPVTSTELEFYRDKIAAYAKTNAIILNKSDIKQKAEIEQLVADTQVKIASACNLDAANVRVLPVSAEHWMMYNHSHSERMKVSSRCEEVRAYVDGILPAYKEKLLMQSRDILAGALGSIAEPLDYQLSQLEKPDMSRQEAYQAKLKELQQMKYDLASPGSELRKKFSSVIRKSQNEVISELTKQSILFSTECLDAVLKRKEAQGAKGGEWVLKQINLGLEALASEVDMKIDLAFRKVNDMLGGMLEITSEGFANRVDVDLTAEQTSVADKACRLARHTLPGLGIMTLTGFVLSGLFTGGATWVAGLGALAAAGGFVYKTSKDTSVHTRIMELKTKLSPQITIVMSDLKQYVQQRYDTFNEALVDEMEKLVAGIVDEMNEVVASLKEAQRDQQAREEKKKQLQDEIKYIQTLKQQASLLFTNPFAAE